MDIASIYVKNMLWSLFFWNPGWVCVCSSESKKSSLCKGPPPHSTSMPFVQEGICCDCLGKFYASSAQCRELCKRGRGKKNKKGNPCFLLCSSSTREIGRWCGFLKVFCWSPGKKKADLSLAGIPIHCHAGSLNGGVLSWRRSHGNFLPRGKGWLAFRECIAVWVVQGVRCDLG